LRSHRQLACEIDPGGPGYQGNVEVCPSIGCLKKRQNANEPGAAAFEELGEHFLPVSDGVAEAVGACEFAEQVAGHQEDIDPRWAKLGELKL
jgi:hypothetical protein